MPHPVRRIPLALFVSLLVCLTPLAHAQTTFAGRDVTAIQQLMDKQVADWNKGDIPAFVASYKNSPDILFVGNTVQRGYAQVLERYRKNYPTHEAMGTLTFSNLEVAPLDARFATATGNFHLTRGRSGGGDAQGIFSLVFEKTAGGWKIIRDHTTAFPRP